MGTTPSTHTHSYLATISLSMHKTSRSEAPEEATPVLKDPPSSHTLAIISENNVQSKATD